MGEHYNFSIRRGNHRSIKTADKIQSSGHFNCDWIEKRSRFADIQLA